MENFLDTVFPFLLISVVVVSRVALAIRRRNRGRQGSSSAPAAPSKPARGFVLWEEEFREPAPAENSPAQTGTGGDDDDDDGFSAWDLSVNEEPSIPPPLLPKAPPPAPVTAVRFGAVAERLAMAPNRTPPALDRVAAPPEPIAADPERPLRPAPKAPEQCFRGLSPLQQAVVWAELLGAPKGF
ncbi:MAG: hypothetical protein LBK63_09865 [Treponema sp.]|nr:hypothetical protein [Treponema sp.]